MSSNYWIARAGILLAFATNPAHALLYTYPDALPDYCQIMPAVEPTATMVELKRDAGGAICSVRQLIERLQKLAGKPEKGEFETTAEFESRLAKRNDVELLSGRKVSEPITIVFPASNHWLKYDADNQTFSTNNLNTGSGPIGHLSGDALQSKPGGGGLASMIPALKYTTETVQSYRSAFGAEVKVKKEEGHAWAILPEPEWNGSSETGTITFAADRSDAAQVKQNFSIALSGKLSPNPIAETYEYSLPTTDHPWATEVAIHALRFKVSTVLLFRADTGAVLSRGFFDDRGIYHNGLENPRQAVVLPSKVEASPEQTAAVPNHATSVSIQTRPGAPPAYETSPSFQRGKKDRTSWEQWFGQQSGDLKAGAQYWTTQRSLRHPGTCKGSTAFQEGCTSAKRWLSEPDNLRKTDPQYWWGWNSL